MAETYGVFDLRTLPLQTVAILAQGLHPTARIMQKLIAIGKEKSKTVGFETPEEFLAARAKIMTGQ